MESAFDDEKGLSVIVEPQHRSGSSATLVVDRQPESSTGLEMGSLFVQAQRFADETASEAERKAQEVISAAEAKAAEILQHAAAAQAIASAGAVATAGAARLQDGAVGSQTRPPIPPEAIADLSAAIEEFADTNRTLTAEIVKLRQVLGESYAAAPESQSFHPDPTSPTSNTSNGSVLPSANG